MNLKNTHIYDQKRAEIYRRYQMQRLAQSGPALRNDFGLDIGEQMAMFMKIPSF